jgi:hypothetical protein
MKVANIVSTSNIKVSDEFNVVKAIGEIIHSLPTLIVGYDYVNKHYPNFDITNIKLDENLYWTFKRTERRDKFEEDLEWFKTKVFEDLTKQVNYVFVDPIQRKTHVLWKIVRKIANLKHKITYIQGEMVYIYGDNLIFGIDLKLLRFMSMNIDKIKDKIKQISDVFLDDNKILIEYKKNVGKLGDQVRYIPFLYSVSNGQNDSSSLIHLPRKS